MAPVTISMMLQHRGGFKRSGNNDPWSASNARARLATGDLGTPSPPPVGERSYSNSSMGMFHFMMLGIANRSLWAHYETTYRDLPDTTYDRLIAARNAEWYTAYTQKFVFDPANVSATCRMQDIIDSGGPFSLLYGSPTDHSGAVSPDNSLHCASGGWIMSIKQLMRLVHTLKHSDKILSRATYALMEDGTLAPGEAVAKDDASLGWWRKRIRGGWAFTHNGAVLEGGGAANSHVIIYPNGYHAAVVSNSVIPPGLNPDQALVDAFEASYTPRPGVTSQLPDLELAK